MERIVLHDVVLRQTKTAAEASERLGEVVQRVHCRRAVLQLC